MNLFLFFWIFLKASLLSFGGMGSLPFLHKDLMALGWAKNPISSRPLQSGSSARDRTDCGALVWVT